MSKRLDDSNVHTNNLLLRTTLLLSTRPDPHNGDDWPSLTFFAGINVTFGK
ncbi:hypothetical protein [Pseudomonas sp. MPB23]|uniref:hypothetical protein n=1 Tax=Pseudomonas sp. MPB23 TaxID=3388490 RepID=UPI003984C49F